MDRPGTIGLDLAKSVFEGHGMRGDGAVVRPRQPRRGRVLACLARLEPCPVGMEACSGAHCRARECLELGHDVRMMPPSQAKPYAKRGKTDAADAEAICGEARPCPQMRPRKRAERHTAKHALRCGDVGGGEAPNASGPRERRRARHAAQRISRPRPRRPARRSGERPRAAPLARGGARQVVPPSPLAGLRRRLGSLGLVARFAVMRCARTEAPGAPASAASAPGAPPCLRCVISGAPRRP
jgi:hypothetical protein